MDLGSVLIFHIHGLILQKCSKSSHSPSKLRNNCCLWISHRLEESTQDYTTLITWIHLGTHKEASN